MYSSLHELIAAYSADVCSVCVQRPWGRDSADALGWTDPVRHVSSWAQRPVRATGPRSLAGDSGENWSQCTRQLLPVCRRALGITDKIPKGKISKSWSIEVAKYGVECAKNQKCKISCHILSNGKIFTTHNIDGQNVEKLSSGKILNWKNIERKLGSAKYRKQNGEGTKYQKAKYQGGKISNEKYRKAGYLRTKYRTGKAPSGKYWTLIVEVAIKIESKISTMQRVRLGRVKSGQCYLSNIARLG